MAQNPISISKGGKIETRGRIKATAKNLSLLYTPGVADLVRAIEKDRKKSFTHTWRGKTVAIVSDGSAVLGLGNQSPEAAMAVMEAKALLFKELGGLNAVPLVIATQDPEKIIELIKNIAPSFGGINMEDIAAPRCFIVKEALKKELNIPVFHDDQYGTAIVVLAGLINASKVAKKNLKKAKVVISGAGAAGIASAKLLTKFGVEDIIVFDSQGPLYVGREGLNFAKQRLAQKSNPRKFKGNLKEALVGADIFIGLSQANLLISNDIAKMNKKAIVFALANPIPEIMPKEARKGGAFIVATGRSDFPNQINNVLVFPGIFKGAMETRTVAITDEIKIQAAKALAATLPKPQKERIMIGAMDKRAVRAIAGVFGKKKL